MTHTAASSDETLVDPLHFVLSHDNPTHTIIRGPGRQKLYHINSNPASDNTTVISKFVNWEGETILQEVATIYWSKMGFHRIRLVGSDGLEGKAVKVAKLLRSGPLFSETVSIEDLLGRRYEWRGSQTAKRLMLYSSDQPSVPIAKFQRSRPDEMSGGRLKAYLRVEHRGQELLDTVIWSWCYLEKGRRDLARIGRRL